MRELIRRTLIVAGLVLAAIIASTFPASLELSRGGLASGEYWRLLTGPFVHATLSHGLLDVGALAILLIGFGIPRRALAFSLFGVALIGPITLAVHPEFASTCGLSGLLHGLFVLSALEQVNSQRGWRRALFACAVVAVCSKAVYETTLGNSLLTGGIEWGAPVAYVAHLLGALLGLAIGLAPRLHAPHRQTNGARDAALVRE